MATTRHPYRVGIIGVGRKGTQHAQAFAENGRAVLELAIALRESERRGLTPVKVPLADRSLQILPAASRMYWKKEVHGEEWYAEQMASQKRD